MLAFFKKSHHAGESENERPLSQADGVSDGNLNTQQAAGN